VQKNPFLEVNPYAVVKKAYDRLRPMKLAS
jgi:hypothetical protein